MTVLLSDTEVEAWGHQAKVWARQLGAIDDELGRASAHLAWTGARYFDFRARMGGTRQAVSRAQIAMASAAQYLHQVAASLKAQRQRLWQDQNLVTQIVGGPDGREILRKAGYTADALPAPYDTEWADLAKKVVAVTEHHHPLHYLPLTTR